MARQFLFENPLSPHRPKIWLFFFSSAKCLNPIWWDLLMAIISHKLIKSRQSFPFFFLLLKSLCAILQGFIIWGYSITSTFKQSQSFRIYTVPEWCFGVQPDFIASIFNHSHLQLQSLICVYVGLSSQWPPFVNRPISQKEKGQSWHTQAKESILSYPLHPALFENETLLVPPWFFCIIWLTHLKCRGEEKRTTTWKKL